MSDGCRVAGSDWFDSSAHAGQLSSAPRLDESEATGTPELGATQGQGKCAANEDNGDQD